MSDKLVVEIDSKDAEVAMRNLDRLTTAAEQMGKAFENTKGATSALRELRLMLTGIKGQGSSLDELKNSIQSLNSTADSLKRSFAGSVGQLGRIFKNEMAELKSIVQETGLGVGRAAAKGIEDGIGGAAVAVKKAAKEVNDTLGIEFVQGIRNAAKTATAEAAKLGLAFSEIARSAEAGKTRTATAMKALEADLLKDELAYQAQIQTARKGMQADLLKDELAYQAQIQTARKGLHADLLKDELAYHAQQKTLKDGLQADTLKDELAYQAQIQTARKGMQADLLKDELAYQAQQKTVKDGLQADLLKDELAYQAQIQTARKGMQADLLKDELAYQAQIQTARKGMQADLLKDELAYQAQQKTLKDGLQADLLKDELAYQAQIQTARKGMQADLLKDELAYQAQQKTLKDGLQADLLKDELAYQAQIQTARKGMQADLLKDELAYQARQKTLKDGLQADMLKDELAYQAQQKKMQEAYEADRLKDLMLAQARYEKELKDGAKRQLEIDRHRVAAAMNAPSGDYQRYDPSSGLKGSIVKSEDPRKVDALSASFRKLTIDGNDAHSMTRGLASGFDLLWLTWGNIAPLLSGAAISNTFMQTVKIGLQVQDTLTTIAALGKENGETFEAMGARVAKLNDKLIELGNSSIYGPRELAEAMQILTLAGLKADEVITGLGPTLQLAMAGTTSVQTAADVLVSITTAFGMGADGFQRAADVIVRAAADSKASVESIGEAMKLASVAGEQYGASLDDVGVLIAALANVGIQGSAAGTAIRNMFADMSERTPKAAAAMKKVGLEFRDAAGNVKPLIENTKELFNVLQQLDGKSGKNLLADIFSERGGKAAIAALVDYKTQIKDIQGNLIPWSEENNKLAQSLRNIANSAGDAFIASAIKAESGLNSFKQAGAILQTTMYTAFQAVEPQLYMLSVALREAFASPEVLNAITALAKGVMNLAEFVAEHVKTISILIGIWGSVKLAGIGFALAMDGMKKAALAMLTVFPSMIGGTSALARAVNELAVARNSEAVAALAAAEAERRAGAAAAGSAVGNAARLGTFARLAGILPGIGTAISLAATAWSIYDIFFKQSNETAKEYTDVHSGKILKAIEDETSKLARIIELRGQGLTVMEAELRLKDELAAKDTEAAHTPKIDSARKALNEANAKAAAARARVHELESLPVGSRARQALSVARRQLESYGQESVEAAGELRSAYTGLAASQKQLTDAQTRHKAFAQAAQNARDYDMQQEAERRRKLMDELFGKGGMTYDRVGNEAFGGPREFYEDQKTAFDKSIQEIDKRGRVEVEKLQSIAADKKAILDSEQQAGLISTEEYNSQLMVLLKSSEDAQIAEIRKTSKEFRAEYDNRHRTISDLIAKAEATPAKGKEASAAKAANLKELRAELSTLEELGVTSFERWASAIDKLTSRYDKDLQVAINKNLGSLKKLKEEDDKFWKDQTDELAKAKALDAVNQQYANINESVFSLDEANKAYALAFADSASKSEAYIGKLSTELETAQYAAEEFWYAAVADGEFSDTDSSGYISYLKKIQGLEKLILEARRKGVTLAGDTGQAAFDRKRREQNIKLANDLSDAVMTGLFDGAEAGKKKLRDVLVAELRKPIKMVVDLVMNVAVNGIMGSLGLGGAAGGGGGIMGGIQTASNLNTLYGAGSQALFGASAGASAASLGYANIVGAVGGDALGALAAANGMWAGVATGAQAAAQAAIASNAAMAAGTAAALPAGTTAAAAGASAGSMAAAAIPYVAVAALVGNALGLFRSNKQVNQGIKGTLAYDSDLTAFEQWRKGGSLFSGPKYYDKDRPMDSKTADALDQSVRSVYTANEQYAQALGLTADSIRSVTRDIRIETKGLTDAQVQEKLQAEFAALDESLAKGILDDFGKTLLSDQTIVQTSIEGWTQATVGDLQSAIGIWSKVLESGIRENGDVAGRSTIRWVKDAIAKGTDAIDALAASMWEPYQKAGETAAQTLARLGTSLATVNSAFDMLGVTMLTASIYSGDYASKLIDTMGGGDAFTAKLGTYYENFYSEAEKTANVTRSVSDALAAVGLAMPTTRDEFRALVESQLALGEGGTKAVAALLGVSGAFASVVPAAEALGNALSETMKRLQSDTADLEIDLLRAQGNTAGADAAQRTLDTTGLTEAEVAIYDYNVALRAQIDTIKGATTLRSSLIGLESSFAGGGFSRQYLAEDAANTVSGLLADVGIQKDVNMFAEHLLSATSEDVELYFRQIWNVLKTDEARQKLVDVTGVMMDLAQGAGSAAEALQKQQDALQTLAQDAARLFSARNSAGDLMDRISGAMGKQGTFGAQRESELWGALGNTRDAEKQVELASQLTDLVLSRQQLEVQNAERMLDFGRSLRDYVDGLKLGSLSPLTNAEKLAEASTQYSEMLGKAQGGDADAQAGLQGIASTYLDLARTYFAGNEQFSAIFGSVTSSLDALGVSSMSEAQQQLSLGTQSLGELQRLYSITETAYGSLNAQYETAVGELAAAQDALVLQSDSLDQLKDIAGLLSGLPAEIAVRLPAINTESATYLPLAMPVQQGDNAALIAELQALRKEVADLRAENRQDAQMVAGATVASASASASQIADATAKAAYTTTVKQGAVLI